MIVDIGGGTSEVAIISLSGIVFSRSLRVGGDEFDETIVAYMKRAYNLMIGERTAEDIKIRIGSAFPLEQELTMEVKGRDLVAGLPKTMTIRSQEIREALQEPLSSIVESVRITLERCPPELSADLVDRGIVLAGGGALLRGLDRLLQKKPDCRCISPTILSPPWPKAPAGPFKSCVFSGPLLPGIAARAPTDAEVVARRGVLRRM